MTCLRTQSLPHCAHGHTEGLRTLLLPGQDTERESLIGDHLRPLSLEPVSLPLGGLGPLALECRRGSGSPLTQQRWELCVCSVNEGEVGDWGLGTGHKGSSCSAVGGRPSFLPDRLWVSLCCGCGPGTSLWGTVFSSVSPQGGSRSLPACRVFLGRLPASHQPSVLLLFHSGFSKTSGRPHTGPDQYPKHQTLRLAVHPLPARPWKRTDLALTTQQGHFLRKTNPQGLPRWDH